MRQLAELVAKEARIERGRFVAKLASRPGYVKFLLNRHARNRVFALTILRIWIAYRVGAMRYGVFTFVKV